ncbi:hypothetical protein REPUB_Repub01dG0020500 [Reevesia pubescens]
MDLRLWFPPILNLVLSLFLSPWNWNLVVSSIFVKQFSILELALLLFLTILFLLLFLFTSIEVPVNLNPIRFRSGAFSIALTTSLLASIFFPPSLFWTVHLLIIFLSPWHSMLFALFKHFSRLFSRALQLLPTFSIMIITQNEQSSDSSSPLQNDIELGLQDQDQQNSEHED